MTDLPDLAFEFDSTRTAFTDEAYAAAGRALTFATRFEANGRAVAGMNVLKQLVETGKILLDSSAFDEALAEFAADFWSKQRLRHNTNRLAFQYDLPVDVREAISKARKARNEVAHEVTLGLDARSLTEEGRKNCLDLLGRLVEQIAAGDRIVALIIQAENGDPLPTSSRYDSYVARAIKWVQQVE